MQDDSLSTPTVVPNTHGAEWLSIVLIAIATSALVVGSNNEAGSGNYGEHHKKSSESFAARGSGQSNTLAKWSLVVEVVQPKALCRLLECILKQVIVPLVRVTCHQSV